MFLIMNVCIIIITITMTKIALISALTDVVCDVKPMFLIRDGVRLC